MKTLAIATLVAATATAATAGNTIFPIDEQDDNASFFELPLVRADAAGIVVIENFRGDVLASAPVNAGVNTDVKTRFGIQRATGDVVAKLIVDGVVVDTQDIRVAD
ncbi:MAG: hypothetical protein ACU0CO_05130 [Shimia sp.]